MISLMAVILLAQASSEGPTKNYAAGLAFCRDVTSMGSPMAGWMGPVSAYDALPRNKRIEICMNDLGWKVRREGP